ncbi:lipopolysaccharide biosynthesis protein [Massilia solisilvae]|uniref:Lipopolysaccharide biosynthesis protein n=1 Tax=Massilia solisilvae TaxID=1811225 RepID=A0ABT2BEN8_9BURK|nr:lipopolysaccharide biosynthesis protein [Massilia solisilvae]MCS0606979.1 lipopolysaccharide biosynthesis protein [Massilia solisilvae]
MATNIQSRFVVSFVSNLVRSGVTFGTGMLLARWMGPADYGRMAFLMAAFTALRGMLDMGSSTAFFTLLSRRPRSSRFIGLFWSFVGIQMAVALLFLLLLLPDTTVRALWAGESRLMLGLAFLATFMQGTVWLLAVQMAEASRQTVRSQQINTAVVVVHLGVVLALAWAGMLAVPLVFAALAIEWAAAAWLASRLYRGGQAGGQDESGGDTPKSVFLEFFHYCLPLVPMTFLGFVHDFADRWMLQTWAGVKQQAYFSVAQQYSAIALLATVSVLRILWKEIAEAHHQGNLERVGALYRRASRMLFFVGAFLAGAMQPLASDILRLTVGEAYVGGTLAMAIMLLYPVHQSMGQIGGTLSFATGHTRAYAWSSSVGMAISLVVAYLVLAPATAPVPGLHMGAEGLALKLVGAQVISVNVLAWMIARIFGWRFDWHYQVFALAGCVCLGWLAHWLAWQALGADALLLLKLPLMAALYTGFIGVYLYFFPWLLSMTREELVGHLAWFQRLSGIKKLSQF